MRGIPVLVAALIAGAACLSLAQGVGDVRITTALRAIAMKGGFPTDAAWGKAQHAGPFLVAGRRAQAPVRTVLWILFDDEGLYVKVRCDDPNAADLCAEKVALQSVFSNDCVELFLGSPDHVENQMHFAVDARGQRFAEYGGPTPKKPWRSRVERDAGGYTVWMAVPYESVPWARPAEAECWRIKVGRESKTGGGNCMWPFNPDPGFHSPQAWGLVYFARANLIANPRLEELDKRREPLGWALVPGNKRWGIQGTVGVVPSPRPKGGSAVRIEKKVAEAWYPQLHAAGVTVKPGATYEATAWVQSDQEWRFRYTFLKKDAPAKKLSKAQPASPKGMARRSLTFAVPKGYDRVTLGFHIVGNTGTMIVDDVALRLIPQALPGAHATKGPDAARPDPVHRLIELSRRTRMMPTKLLLKDGKTYPCERVIFKDTATGATIWRMTRAPGFTRHYYSNISPWNANGSLIMLRSNRDHEGKFSRYLLPADGSRLAPIDVNGSYWCPVHPERIFYTEYLPPDKAEIYLCYYNVKTGEKRRVGPKLPRSGLFPGPSHDGKKLLAVQNGYSRTARKSIGHIVDVETGVHTAIDFGYVTHQVWFTGRPDYTISLNYEVRNKYFKESGGGSLLINADGTNLRRIRRKHCSHRGFGPDGKRVAFHGGGIRVMNVDGTDEKVVARVGGGHLSWQVTPDWLVVTAGNAIRCIAMKEQGFKYRISCPNTALRFSEYWTEAHLDSSPDGTKIGYASSMMGETDFYQVVSRLPAPPRNLRARVQARTVSLQWEAPRFHKEVKGYLVYRSDTSGLDYQLVTRQPVEDLTYGEPLPAGLDKAYYLVTALEHSGIEGRPSAEACASTSGGWDGPVRHYYEMEDAVPVRPLMEHYDSAASALYVMRTDGPADGTATLTVNAPRAGAYSAWVRARASGAATAVLSHGDTTLESPALRSDAYRWFRLGEVRLEEGRQELKLACAGEDLRLDSLFLTDDADATPLLDGLWDKEAPPAPSGLRAAQTNAYEVGLAWHPVEAPDVAYYNVYASATPDFICRQEQRVASPAATEHIDWGLKQDTGYYYKVTAVDRRGNESAPSPQLAVRTRPVRVVLLRKQVGQSPATPVDMKSVRRMNAEDLKQMGAAANRAHRLPTDGPLSVSFDVPADGEYVMWVKLTPRGATRRFGLVTTVNGRAIAWSPSFNFIAFGHSGPTPGIFKWDMVGFDRPEREQRVALKKGPATLECKAEAGEVEIAEVVLTNDLGWQPNGIINWLPVNPE